MIPVDRFIVMTSGARTSWKAQQFGVYKNVAVVETDGLGQPKMITERAKHLIRIIRHYGAIQEGSVAYLDALRDADQLALTLNSVAEPPHCPTCGQQILEAA